MTNDEFRHSFKTSVHNTLGLAVYSCGVQKCGAHHTWGPAVRDHYLIHCVISGKGLFTCKGETYSLSAGDGFLVSPSEVVSYAANESEPWEYCWVGFNGSDAKRLMAQTGLLQSSPVFHYEQSSRLEELLMGISNHDSSEPSAEIRMEAGLLLFLAELTDLYGAHASQPYSGFEYVQKAIRYIDFNYSSDIDINDIAASAGISRSYLYRLFMQHISMSPNEYLMRFRISKGAELLGSGRLSVGEVAYSTGFSDQLYFSRVFKKYMGMPPSRYSALERGIKKEEPQ
ncbi:MAG: AraC family transcriptional regulator [Clostridiales bacterium]|jgi:AraC-like DNA-binding protein|nr:AraC family transcriptional regulator [Clostridiales bacterium]